MLEPLSQAEYNISECNRVEELTQMCCACCSSLGVNPFMGHVPFYRHAKSRDAEGREPCLSSSCFHFNALSNIRFCFQVSGRASGFAVLFVSSRHGLPLCYDFATHGFLQPFSVGVVFTPLLPLQSSDTSMPTRMSPQLGVSFGFVANRLTR